MSPVVPALSGVLFFRMLGIFIVLPIIAVAAKTYPDSDNLTIGIALGGYGITQAVMQIPVGILADRYGRKPVLMTALAVFAAGGFLAADADSVYGLIAGRLLQGLGAVASVAVAWIGDVIAPDKRARAMGLVGGAIGAAFVLSLFVAPPLASAVGLAGVLRLTGWLGVLSVLLLIPIKPPAVATAATRSRDSFPSLLAMPPLRRLAGGAFVLHYGVAAMFILLPNALAGGTPTADYWMVYGGGFCLALLPGVPLLLAVDKHYRPVSALAIAALMVGTVLFYFAAQPAVGVAALVFFFCGFIVMEAAIPAQTSRAAPAHQRAAAIGIVTTCQFLGIFAGGALTGWTLSVGDGGVGVGVACALLGVWFVSHLVPARRRPV